MADVRDAFPRVVALFDYVARTDRELTFRAGDIMMITEMLSDDWFEGELEGSMGLIPAAYVKHVKDWKALAAVRKPGPPSPQLTRRTADSGGRAASAPMPDTSSDRVPVGRSPSPLVSRKAGSVGPVDSTGPASASTAMPQPSESPSYGGLQLPGMGAGKASSARGSAIFRPGASDDELIKPHKIAMQPDRPDLAKALSIRNQAARVGAPMKTGPNELARHLEQLKTKSMYKNRIDVDPQTAELKKRLELQSVRNASKEKTQEMTELQQRMAKLAQKRQD